MHALKREIEERYGSVYRFVQATGVARSTVYAVLADRYPGNQDAQAQRIADVLHGAPRRGKSAQEIYQTLKRVACERCPDKNAPGPRCQGCVELFKAQAEAIAKETQHV